MEKLTISGEEQPVTKAKRQLNPGTSSTPPRSIGITGGAKRVQNFSRKLFFFVL